MHKVLFAVLLLMLGGTLFAGTIYTDRSLFEGALGATLTDSYSAADGYPSGFNIYSDSAMSAFFGETKYRTTGFPNWNMVNSDVHYCAGCNGSFLLDFTETSLGTASGVYGVGMAISTNSDGLPYHAFITFGDNTTLDHALPPGESFFGIIDPQLIRSIHLGLSGGAATTSGSFTLESLTIGSLGNGNGNGTVVIPEPALTAIVGLALVGLALRRRRQQRVQNIVG
ncbi:MAG: PEP-CTERM sorting domain-containing protein [Bryobacteraceae bacterium]|nr:PEP-CTERM sorting domain-containing protein [Solibacteraceae bacterium]MCO5351191.1 PEP-CTERM sorting domain-containing protein [Bryobacteraceae bacterium]